MTELGPLRRFLESVPPELLEARGDGAGVRVAIVDSGVDATHPALAGSVERSVGVQREANAWKVVDVEPADTAGHGTACAGIVLRLAPACRIWSVRILGEAARGQGSALLAALDWAIASGADVLNVSLGTRSPEMAEPLRSSVDTD